MATICAAWHDTKGALHWLEGDRATLGRCDLDQGHLRLDNIRDEPGFREVLDRMRFAGTVFAGAKIKLVLAHNESSNHAEVSN